METITAKTIAKALRDHRDGQEYVVTDERTPGLMMRVRPRGVRWTMRARVHGVQRRWDLGLVVAGDLDVDGVCLGTARSWAIQIRDYARKNLNPGPFIDRVTGRMAAPVSVGPRPDRVTLLWSDAVAQFLLSAYDPKNPDLAANRPSTKKDYRSKLAVRELNPFHGRAISTITVREIAEANLKTCQRKYHMGAGSLRTLKAFYVWLRDPVRSASTGVTISIADLKKPAQPRGKEVGRPGVVFDAEKEARGKAPPAIELGRVLAIARAGVLPKRVGLTIELMLASVQRRRQTIGASARRFITYDETPNERAWFVPPYFRKTRKGGSRSHLVPIVGFGAVAFDALAEMAEKDGREWLFPTRLKKLDRPADEGVLNKWIEAFPGVEMSTHGGRYAFPTYGAGQLGFKPKEAKLILDHSEGVEPDDVTGNYYAFDTALARKREMMVAWTDWLEKQVLKAYAADPGLRDTKALRKLIYDARYAAKIAAKAAKAAKKAASLAA